MQFVWPCLCECRILALLPSCQTRPLIFLSGTPRCIVTSAPFDQCEYSRMQRKRMNQQKITYAYIRLTYHLQKLGKLALFASAQKEKTGLFTVCRASDLACQIALLQSPGALIKSLAQISIASTVSPRKKKAFNGCRCQRRCATGRAHRAHVSIGWSTKPAEPSGPSRKCKYGGCWAGEPVIHDSSVHSEIL